MLQGRSMDDKVHATQGQSHTFKIPDVPEEITHVVIAKGRTHLHLKVFVAGQDPDID
jgi:hypothetical protein